jgi:hypothetical protein
MSILPNQTNINNDTYFFLLVDAKVINTSTINANTGLYDKLFVNTISTGSLIINNISTLTASISSLNTNNISSGTGYISSFSSDSINVSSLVAQTGFISSLFSDNIRVSSFQGQTGFISSLFSDNIRVSSLISDNIRVSSLIGQAGALSSLVTNNLSSGVAVIQNLTAQNINGNSNWDASNWSLYRAFNDVSGTLGAFSIPLNSISDFLNITCANNLTAQNGSVTAGLNVVAGLQVSAPVGSFDVVTVAEDINVSATNKTADVNIYGVNLLPGDNALYVEGGTTLSGGGVIHGVTIGALQVGGIDTVRIDVLPAGLALNSATFITANAIGAANVAAGGALSLAGGSYIEYNSDQHYFRNTTSGNDFTDIYVGNIFPADAGSANLRINGGGQGSRGVELSNVKSLYLDGQNSFITGSPTTSLAVGGISSVSISTNFVIADFVAGIQQLLGTSTFTQDIQLYSDIPLPWDNTVIYIPKTPLSDPNSTRVEYLGNNYDCVATNLNLIPNQPIPDWLNSSSYAVDNIAFVNGVGSYRCVAPSAPNPLPPNNNFAEWVPFNPTNAISNVWFLNNSPITSGITGDKYSYINVGTGLFSNLRLDAISTNTISSGLINTDVIIANILAGYSTITNYIELPSGAPPSAIVGDSNSYIRVGSGYFDNIITSTINVSTINATNISSITAESITTEFLKASYISTGFLSASNISTTSVVADTLYSYSTLTSTINFTFAKGEAIELQADVAPVIAFYRNIDGVQQVDTVIATNNTIGFNIFSISTIGIQAQDDIGINSANRLALVGTNGVFVDAPTVIVNSNLLVNSNATISSINTYFISSFNTEVISASELFANTVFTSNLGHPNPLIPTPINVNNALDLIGNDIIGVDELSADILTTQSISTNRISTGVLASGSIFTNSYNGSNAGANLNMNGSIIPTSAVPKDLGASGAFRWRNLWVSTISSIHTQSSTITATNTITANTVATDRLTGGPTSIFNTFTNNLFPSGAFLGVGYGSNTAQGGYYQQGNFRSTFTNVIQPATDAGQLSNVVRINGVVSTNNLTTNLLAGSGPFGKLIYTDSLLPNGSVNIGNAPINSFQQGWFNTTYTNTIQANTNTGVGINSTVRVLGTLSTQNLMVSSINLKQYAYTSTLNIPFSSFSITGNQAGTPILLYSNVDFRTQGFHRISQKSILSKNTGGSSADIHANIFYTVGAFPSTPSITDGYSALPVVNQDNASTFTTLLTEFYVSTPTTRNILYYDATANNYTARLYLGTLFDSYTPQFGINPERIPANIL